MDLAGIYPPITTPFADATGDVDLAALRQNVDRWMTTGLRGLVALGSNGEATMLDETESDRVVGTVREGVPADRLVIAGTGRESVRATIDASRRAATLGADAVLVRTPSYFKAQMTDAAFLRYYTAVADATPIPVILYNYTALTGVSLSLPVVSQLSRHPNIIGMKESGSDAGYVAGIVDGAADGFQLLVGSAPTLYPSLLLGAAGAILALACVAADPCVALFDHVRAGRLDEARTLQRRLTPLARLVTRAHGVPGLKATLGQLGFVGGAPRPPLAPVEPAVVDTLREALAELDLLAPAGTPVAQSV